MKAPIIVLEGLDACGKSTQTHLLEENLQKKGLQVGFVRFPGYEVSPAGRRIAAYLRGEFGKMNTLDPRLIANLYAADRLFQIEAIEKLRDEKDVVIFDRGVTSNLIYTPARGKNETETAELEAFIEKLEYEVFGFPKESLVIFLDASREARKKIHAAKNRLADLHEADESYLEKVQTVALARCKKDFRWVRIPVDRSGDLRRREEIAKEIFDLVLEKLQKSK
ncbi:AAA family ATPase [Candidatus Gracilibacteria bacterium]|nr:AAA family ATPase [Candidatus Gracilibacteria bacterium]